MGGLRGVLRPAVWHVGILAHLLPHLQKPHPAAPCHEHRSVRMMAQAKANIRLKVSELFGEIRQMCGRSFFCNSKHCSTALCNLQPGVTIFDCEEKTLESIAEKMVSEMVSKKELRPKDRDGVLKSLLQNPRYPPAQQPPASNHNSFLMCPNDSKLKYRNII